MTRLNTPIKTLELKGAYLHDPKRRKVENITDKAIGDPPTHLDENEKKIWAEIIFYQPPGLVVATDRPALAKFCQLEAKTRAKNITASEAQLWLKLLQLFGMTPSSRAALATPAKPAATNPFGEFVS